MENSFPWLSIFGFFKLLEKWWATEYISNPIYRSIGSRSSIVSLTIRVLTQYTASACDTHVAVKLFRTSRVTRVATTRERSFPSVDKYIQGWPLAQPSVSSRRGRVARFSAAASPVLTRRLSTDCPSRTRWKSTAFYALFAFARNSQRRHIRPARSDAWINDSAPIEI